MIKNNLMYPVPVLLDYRKDTSITGSHEEFWVFTESSQYGGKWSYSQENDKKILEIQKYVQKARDVGIKLQLKPRLIHYAQLFLWRFYLKKNIRDFPPTSVLPMAYESAAQILEFESPREKIIKEIGADRKSKEIELHFSLVQTLNFNMRVHHPSEYLPLYIINHQENLDSLAESIISDSFLLPTCILYKPAIIAEGAAIMAAAMLNLNECVNAKSAQTISFIQDMKMFYKTYERQQQYH